MRIAIGGDSAGEGLAKILVEHFSKKDGWTVVDMSRPRDGSVELYADLSERVALAIIDGEFDRGILCCGTGIGVCMSANKIPGIRAAQTHDTYSAERAALSNDAHIITMGGRVIGPELAKCIAEAWFSKTFDPASSSAKNVAGVDALGQKYASAKHEKIKTSC
ncbi:D-erythrulose-4-phosphate isomerase [Brytella acorum]|uniref:RpiB/LacA/LacB family sugar-phosphate isomerase n=1 Tax=Brytella acorum TaxID=2959299 RepID=A0AA35UPK5_9PROT|nr:RpiB/LacA/LacB family sugar-phosphate isomerase [Brytella acorum]MDF3625677.1 RpiB/LacA/LacB family sugar-phosphate isomerase [Brytella acorum]CAI9121306.1 RpiB/LacA/LacB family sugar-phosphate isomerase [Brytella acorum]